MLWRLPAPVRSLLVSHCRTYSSAVTETAEPLRILFCGSDEFSIASLRALSRTQLHAPELIRSIDVVHRPAKPAGRGLKSLRQVPIQKVATQELNLDTHVIDTFTGWTPPTPINLIVAVSFGLFVPPRILNLAKYGGVNVHPSLLPDLRGPAPIHHALLKRRSHTGISVQTLHPNHFDKGLVLAQTPQPGIEVGAGTSPPKLTDRLGQEGAEMLVEVLKTRAFVPPLEDVGWYAASGGSIAHAEKVTKQHRYIDFSNTTIQDIVTVKRVLGDPWCILPNGDRLILNEIQESSFSVEAGQTGLWIPEGSITPLARTADGAILQIEKSTYEGGKTGGGNARLARVLKAGT